MTTQPPRRRMESLFDNRYRYDHIYPRGRSGETLRAYDTQENDRPVVIKRPAPQDAPPMRAGQEVSIRTEKQALERLSGHPVLTELRGSGTFRVGGHTHEYIVMDLAVGDIVENRVLACAGQGEYLAELEVLVILDNLLDLLTHAHDKQVIYNDVDAKHLFWSQPHYQLKVIDWGNAVFTDEPGALPTVSRATDIYQCGELLYFVLTGGNRLDIEIGDNDTFYVNFGSDAERIPAKLQSILTRAVHPDPKRRYGTIPELRHALAEYRQPLEKARDEIIAQVRKRVRPTASQDELEELAEHLQIALDRDPGFPPAVALANEIRTYLRQIAVQADLDATRIYLESGNWPRAQALLHELLPNTDNTNEPLVRFLIAACAMLEEMQISPAPAGFSRALDPLFRGDAPTAAQILLTTSEARIAARESQWLMAETLASLANNVVLLRPHLVRLRHDIQTLTDSEAAMDMLDEVDQALARHPSPGLMGLQVIYQQAGAILSRLTGELRELGVEWPPHVQESAQGTVDRAHRATELIVARLREVGEYAFSNPSQASELLQHAALIDPTSPHFDALHEYFDEIHQAVLALRQFKPDPDGTNLATWFADVQDFMQPYLDDLSDERFHAAVAALRDASEKWTTTINFLALGRRQPAVEMLRATAESIRPYNEQTAAWLGTLANRVPDVDFAEQLSPNHHLADTLIAGWQAWDNNEMGQAMAMGRQALEEATTDGERMAANRLYRLGELLDAWLSDQGPQNATRTDQAETQALAILLADEEQERRTFAEQMPSTSLYLRAMGRGIVAYMRQSSSAGWRALYVHYVLRGMLALHDDNLEEAQFWCDVANASYDHARNHQAFNILDRSLAGRRLKHSAERTLNAISRPIDLEGVGDTFTDPLAAELLPGAERAIQSIEDALRHWSDGAFYDARQNLDAALENIQTAIQVGNLDIDTFVSWLTDLRDAANDLQQTRLTIEQGAVSTSADPDSTLVDNLQHIVRVTQERLGSDYVHQVRQWDEMYQAVLDTYTNQRFTRREKLGGFSRHFASLFITKHPLYPLFRHWETVIEQMPADEVEDELIEVGGSADSPIYLRDDLEPEPATQVDDESQRDLPWNWIIAAAIIVLIVIVGLAVIRNLNDSNTTTDDPASENVPATTSISTAPAAAVGALVPTSTPTPIPTIAGIILTVPDTPIPPTVSPTENAIATPTPAPAVTSTLIPSATPVQVAMSGPESTPNRSVLNALSRSEGVETLWPADSFSAGSDGNWTLSTRNADSQLVTIELGPELLGTLFQPGAASTFVRADAILELIRYDPGAMRNGDVSFGLGAMNADGQQTIGQVQFIEENLVSLGMNQNNQFRSSTQFPVSTPRMTLSIRRTDANTFSFLVDEKSLGDSVYLFARGEPITLILLATGKDVVVEVSEFEVDYRPRSMLP